MFPSDSWQEEKSKWVSDKSLGKCRMVLQSLRLCRSSPLLAVYYYNALRTGKCCYSIHLVIWNVWTSQLEVSKMLLPFILLQIIGPKPVRVSVQLAICLAFSFLWGCLPLHSYPVSEMTTPNITEISAVVLPYRTTTLTPLSDYNGPNSDEIIWDKMNDTMKHGPMKLVNYLISTDYTAASNSILEVSCRLLEGAFIDGGGRWADQLSMHSSFSDRICYGYFIGYSSPALLGFYTKRVWPL